MVFNCGMLLLKMGYFLIKKLEFKVFFLKFIVLHIISSLLACLWHLYFTGFLIFTCFAFLSFVSACCVSCTGVFNFKGFFLISSFFLYSIIIDSFFRMSFNSSVEIPFFIFNCLFKSSKFD